MVTLMQRRREMMQAGSPGAAAPLYPLASGTKTFTSSYKGYVTVTGGNHLSFGRTGGGGSSKNLKVDISTLTANGASMYDSNWANNTTTIFTVSAGDKVRIATKGFVDSANVKTTTTTIVLYDKNAGANILSRSITNGTSVEITLSNGGTVTAIGCNPNIGGNKTDTFTREFDLEIYINDVRYV